MNTNQPFKWISVDDVLPEDVVAYIKNDNDVLCPKQTINVLVRFINLRRENKDVMVIMAHRYYSMVNKNFDGDASNYEPSGWNWSVEWYSPSAPINLKDMQITHWALIPELDE